MKIKRWIVGLMAGLALAAVAVAQEIAKRATAEMSATELCLVAQGAMEDEKKMIENCDRLQSETFWKLSEAISKELMASDDVTELNSQADVKDHRMTGTVYRFNYLGRPVWAMLVKTDTGRGYGGENLLWFKASGRGPKDSEETRLLHMAPEVFNSEMDRDMGRELRRRFGYDSGNVGVMSEFMLQSGITPSLKDKIGELLAGCRKIGDDYRDRQNNPKK